MAQQTERYEDTQLYKIRHSAAHVMAQAVMEMFPDGKVTIGPPVENGFYYDFDLPRNLTPEDLELIEKRMRGIVQGKHEFKKRVVSAEEARQIFADQPYKLELIDGLEKGGLDEYGNPLKEKPEISIYQQDTFVDLCRGPHVQTTKEIKQDAFKLMSIAGAYWRGDEKNKMLQRIYGTAWENKDQLKEYLNQLEEAKKRDHRKLGRELEIFIFDEEVGPGLPLWLPNGTVMIDELEKLAKEMEDKAGYSRVKTPHLTKEDLFIRSGHLPFRPTGPAIGLMEGFVIRKEDVKLEPGDILLLYTDGITEASNYQGILWGEDNLADIIRSNTNSSAEQLIQKILVAMKDHTGGNPLDDDVTLVITKVG